MDEDYTVVVTQVFRVERTITIQRRAASISDAVTDTENDIPPSDDKDWTQRWDLQTEGVIAL